MFCVVASLFGLAAFVPRIAADLADSEIVNGSIVPQPLEHYSFFALPTSSENSDTWLGCGASVISPTHVLTSAHCFGGGSSPCSAPTKLAVWVGDLTIKAGKVTAQPNSKSFRTTAHVVCHDSFDGHCSHGHDVALLKLSQPVPGWVKPVPLNLEGKGKDAEKSELTVVGYGLYESSADVTLITDGTSSRMRKASVSVFSSISKPCRTIFSGGWGCSDPASEGKAANEHQQLCAGTANPGLKTHDTCAGDSGSPMLDSQGMQVGIVSYGGGPGDKKQGPGRSCGDPNYPGVYARISAFGDYIKSKVKDLPSAGGQTAVAMRTGEDSDDRNDTSLLQAGATAALVRRAAAVKVHEH